MIVVSWFMVGWPPDPLAAQPVELEQPQRLGRVARGPQPRHPLQPLAL